MIRFNTFVGIVQSYFLAFGVVVGASVFTGIGAIITNQPPMRSMLDVASSTKIWAMAIALGDSFSTFEVIEKGIIEGQLRGFIKQMLYILVAFLGANMGYGFVKFLHRCTEIWN